jgi:hypothetical protein
MRELSLSARGLVATVAQLVGPHGYTGGVSDERRVFEYRLESLHGESDNELRSVTCERLGDDGWVAYAVSMTGSPFATFVYAAFVCQLAYLRMNATERGLALERVRGRFRMVTDGWLVNSIEAEFWMRLRGGQPTDEDLAFIVERMQGCPVSRNLALAQKQTLLHVESKDSSASTRS